MAIKTKALVQTDGGLRIHLAESSFAGRFTQEELEAAFALVKPATHWKDRIDALIPDRDREVVAAAIEHFTATEATFSLDDDGSLRVRSPGYWAGPAN